MEQMKPILAAGSMVATIPDFVEDRYFPEDIEPGDTVEITYFVRMSRDTGETFGKYAFQCSASYTFME